MSGFLLNPHCTSGAEVLSQGETGWRLAIPAGEPGAYRLAQLDDYRVLRRRDFVWQPPCTISLQGRACGKNLPGTWGFGLWNDPFGAGLAHGGTRLLPALPQAAWFFFASDENYLSFGDNSPAAGPLAGVFRSPQVPMWPFAPLGLALPLLLIKPVSRLVRRTAAALIQERSVRLTHDVTQWHQYQIDWLPEMVRFTVDQQVVLESEVSPRGPLGLVIWLDNQFAAWRPDGSLNYGTLETSQAWIEIQELRRT
ncbi:MAG: family 16 glycosylhydrolase [Anaerolineales bacterium]|nr:family 16 glycosylhydrolase [Anaerolineales bacterium]